MTIRKEDEKEIYRFKFRILKKNMQINKINRTEIKVNKIK